MFTSTTGIVRLSFLVVKNESHYFRIITTILLQNLAIFFTVKSILIEVNSTL